MATLLLIDDDIRLLARLSTQLTEAGYDVIKTSEMAAVESLLAEHQPALVLLEVKTGRNTGWEQLPEIAARFPVIVVSAEGREEEVVRGLDAGAVDDIAKPYRSEELLTRIKIRLPRTGPSHASAAQVAAEPAPLPPVPEPEPDIPEAPEPAAEDVQEHNPPPELPPEPAAKPPVDDRSAFMSDNEELALLRADAAVSPEEQEMLTEDTSLGAVLRTERQRRRVTLVQVENDLHIRMWYLQAMEEENFTLLPRGAMAEQMLRSYATYLNLSVPWVLEEYRRLYASNQVETPTVFSQSRRQPPPRWIIWTAAVILALAVSGGAIFLIDPEGVSALGSNLQQFMTLAPETATPQVDSTAVPQSTTTPETTPTDTPNPTDTPEPTRTPSPQPTSSGLPTEPWEAS